MGVFTRRDSKYWQLYLETAPKGEQKEPTKIVVGTTASARQDSKRLAEELYRERMNEIARKIHRLPDRTSTKAPTFAAFAAIYDADVLEHHKGHEREREILPRLVRDFGPLPIPTITKEVARAWRTRRLKTPTVIEHFGGPKGPRRVLPPPKARTVNREIDLLQQVLAAGVPAHYATSPLADLEDLEAATPIRRTMAPDEERRLLRELAPDDRALFLCALDTLTRFGDVLDIQRIHDHDDLIDIVDPKNGQAHTVPVSTRLRKALDALPKVDPYYFWRRRQAATERDRRNVFAKALKRACAAADVDYGRACRGITFHWATRRTGSTRMIQRGGQKIIAAVQQIGNWKTVDVLMGIYQETTEAEMRAAVESVSRRRRA